MIAPIAIEIFQSWLSCRCFDYSDLIFSLIGILAVIIIETKEKKQANFKQINDLHVKRWTIQKCDRHWCLDGQAINKALEFIGF